MGALALAMLAALPSPVVEAQTTASNSQPAFPAETAERSVAENSAVGVDVGSSVAATDADGDGLTYTLDGADAASFAIVAATGQLRTAAVLNREAQSSYVVRVSVSDRKDDDGDQDTEIDDTITVTVQATNVDEAGVASISVSQPRVGQVLRPRIDDPDLASVGASWAWHSSSDRSAWTRLANTEYHYTPVTADAGKYLKAVGTYTEGGVQKTLEAVTSATVRAAEEDAPELSVQAYVTGLEVPWDMAWAPDGTMFFTERSHGLSVRKTDGTVTRVSADFSDLYAYRQFGLTSVVLDPGFATNRRFYTCHQRTDATHVTAWTIDAGYAAATRVDDPLVALPVGHIGQNMGCRLRFGPEGYLWISTGDGSVHPPIAAGLTSLGGKVLRVAAATGAGAPGNPFSAPNSPLIYSYGHRNPQGLARRPGTSQMWSVEHGPDWDDEISLLTSGGNYGWNRPSQGEPTSGAMTDADKWPGAVEAKWSSGQDSIAPSGGIFLTGDWWGPWEGRLAVAFLKDESLRLFEFTAGGELVSETNVAALNGAYGRLRTTMIGPDGALYVATSNSAYQGGRDSNPRYVDRILRVTPHTGGVGVTVSETALTVAEAGGQATYTVRLDARPTGAVTVTPTSDGASVATASGALTFTTANYPTPQTVTVTGVDDDVDNASDRKATISHAVAGGGYDTVAVASVVVTATDDDRAGVTVSTTALTVAEAGGTATYTVKLDTKPTGSVTVTPTSDDESVATASGALTFTTTNYATPQTVTVTGVDDDVDNATDRTATIGHAATGGGYDGTRIASVAVTATDDEGPGVALSTLSLAVPEAGSATYQARLMNRPAGDVLVAPFSADAGVATVSPSFFAGTALTFTPSNWNTPQTVTVTGVDDAVVNTAVRTTTIGHWAAGGGYGALGALAIDDVAVTLADDEEPPTVSLAASPRRVDEGAAATLTLTLSATLGADVTVPLSYSHLTSEPSDMEAPAEIRVAAGATSGSAELRARQDDDVDDEWFMLWIDAAKLPAYLRRGDNQTHMMILDDDGAPAQVAEVRVVHDGTSLSASWNAPARATVYDVTYYNHRTGENARAAWDRPGTSLTITCDVRPEHLGEYCVDGDSAYTVGVRAGNAAGKSAWVDSARVEPPASASAWLFPSASDPSRLGVVRVVNRSAAAGAVPVTATDDAGWTRAPLLLKVGAGATVEFDSRDLELGGAGLSGATGPGTGDWRLVLDSTLDIEVLPYVRGAGGFAAPMDATAPRDASGALRVALFNPGGETEARSLLRLVNPGSAEARASVSGVDDAGRSPGGPVLLTVPAGAACTVDAAQLETGTGLACGPRQRGLGDGSGRWRLTVTSDAPLVAMNLLASADGRLANLSRIPAADANGVWHVPLFPAASSASGRQGLVRVMSRTQRPGTVSILATDDGGAAYPAVTLPLPAGAAVELDADDLELGSRAKGLSGGTGPGAGSWRLALSGDVAFSALAYARGSDGFLTPMRTAAGSGGRLAYLAPDAGVLRLANAGTTDALVTVAGTDDLGARSASAVWVEVPAGTAVELTASALESGEAAAIVSGALGDGAGVWRLVIGSDTETVSAMSLLPGPMGSLADLSGPAPATKTEHAVAR